MVYLIAIFSQVLDGIARFILKFIRKGNIIDPFIFIKTHAKDILSLIYFSLKITDANEANAGFYIFQAIASYFLYKRAEQLYQCFRITQFALKYEYQFKIFDLLTNLLALAHVCAIVIYEASKINTDNNWIIDQKLTDAPYLRVYLKSFYFACTTILTIGYGDITPVSDPQVIFIIFIEITGVICLGYLINEIGQMLSIIRKKRENMEKDLSAIGKLAKYYNLDSELSNRAKSYIVSNNDVIDYLTPDEQSQVLMKLNDEIRTQITYEDSLNIVKSSIFFMCRWTKSMQYIVAKKLMKKLFSPNQRLSEVSGMERIYVIRKGKINVFMDRFTNQNKSEFRKLLKIIDIDETKQICDNVYGYTAVFSNRNVRMDAIAKDFTLTYSINKADFLVCLTEKEQDFQYYHEIKHKIDYSRICQMWQAPSICSSREHYTPSRLLTIRKALYHQSKLRNARTFFVRYNKMRFINYRGFEEKSAVECMKYRMGTIDWYSLDEKTQRDLHQSTGDLPLKETQKPKAKNLFISKKKNIVIEEESEEFCFQQTSKEYRNFFKKHNLQPILFQYQVENCAMPVRISKISPKIKPQKAKAKTQFQKITEEQ